LKSPLPVKYGERGFQRRPKHRNMRPNKFGS
jgi:hypothetical protein